VTALPVVIDVLDDDRRPVASWATAGVAGSPVVAIVGSGRRL